MSILKTPRVLIPKGNGLNCEAETGYVYKKLGAAVDVIHIRDLLADLKRDKKAIYNYQIISLIGGFSYGDHLGAGTVLATQLKQIQLDEFVLQTGGLVGAVCNGFQAMVKAGYLPAHDGNYGKQTMALTNNDSGQFVDRWVHLEANKESNCVWTKGIDRIDLPIRHGEGKVDFGSDGKEILRLLEANNQLVLFYSPGKPSEFETELPYNPNGSINDIAGVCDPTGRIFGMMPHWEAYHQYWQYPDSIRARNQGRFLETPLGTKIAKNALDYAKKNLLRD